MEVGHRRSAIALEGSLVLLYGGPETLIPQYLKKGGAYHCAFGKFSHDDMIGKKYGTKVKSRSTNRTYWMLAATPELWTLALPHRTQILYEVDIAQVLLRLDVKPGSVVVESGTGSGSLSTSFLRAVAPTGRLHTFEFNQTRAVTAAEEFKSNQIDAWATVKCQDVCEHGFGAQLANSVDAVFLDLPSPWLAIGHAAAVLKHAGRICSFSPCIEQVQRTCLALTEQGFSDIVTIESLLRPHCVYHGSMQELDLFKLPVAAAAAGGGADGNDGSHDEEGTPTARPAKRLRAGLSASACTSTLPHPFSSKPLGPIKGHTSYLTFAVLFKSPAVMAPAKKQ